MIELWLRVRKSYKCEVSIESDVKMLKDRKYCNKHLFPHILIHVYWDILDRPPRVF